jgi:hypothetical protein
MPSAAAAVPVLKIAVKSSNRSQMTGLATDLPVMESFGTDPGFSYRFPRPA